MCNTSAYIYIYMVDVLHTKHHTHVPEKETQRMSTLILLCLCENQNLISLLKLSLSSVRFSKCVFLFL